MIRIRLDRRLEGARAANRLPQPNNMVMIASDDGFVVVADLSTFQGTSAAFRHRTAGIDPAAWADLAGRTAADAVALLFRLPLSTLVLAVSRDTFAQEVTASLERLSPDLAANDIACLAHAAWLAFNDALARGCPGRPRQEGVMSATAPSMCRDLNLKPARLAEGIVQATGDDATAGAATALRALIQSKKVQAGPEGVVRSSLRHLEARP